MPKAFDVRALASTVRIELDDSLSSAEQTSIKAQWVDLAQDVDGEPDYLIRAGLNGHPASDPSGVIQASSPEALAQRITTEVTIAAMGGLRGEALMLHASAVAFDDGRVIGFVGPSGRGKTTAAQVLGRSFGYVTDETLAVRGDGTVVAYPKPLSIGSMPQVKLTEPASSLGLREVPANGLRLAALVLLDRRSEVEQPYFEQVPITEAVAALVRHTSHFAELPHPLRTLVETVLSTGGLRRVVYSEAATLSALAEDLLQQSEDDAPVLTEIARLSERDCDCFPDLISDHQHEGAPTTEPVSALGADRPGTYRRATYVDALMVDDSLMVLVFGKVVVLDGVGPILWLAADGLTVAELREVATRQLPEPPTSVDVDGVIADALSRMEGANLLVKTRP